MHRMTFAAALAFCVVQSLVFALEQPFLVIGHRGACGYRPEHTLASYELARVRWADGDRAGAFDAYARAFQSATNRELFLRSGCALFLLRQDDRTLGEDDPALLQQLATCRNLWRWELRAEVRVQPRDRDRSLAARPGEWVVALYRSQIRPAIGHRCSLQPSCSEYYLQAGRKHGWLGAPLLGDRLVREPGVVAAAEQPVQAGELTLFKDPLDDHDQWLDTAK